MSFNRDVWEGRKPLAEPMDDVLARPTPGARGIGDIALLEIGCTAHNRVDEGTDLEPAGGWIIEILSVPDEYGEVHKAFRTVCIAQGRPNFHVIQEDNVNRQLLAPVNTAEVRKLIRFLCAQVAKTKGPWRPRDKQLLHWAEVLSAVLSPEQNRRSA